MNKIFKKILFWVLAVIITLGASVYQRMTGPTYPHDIKFQSAGKDYTMELPRSHGGDSGCPVEIVLPESFSGRIIFRRFPTNEPWDTLQFSRKADTLLATLPHQPPAGKLEYHVELFKQGDPVELRQEQNTVVRYKGSVPAWVLIPHVFFMFFAMLWSNATGLMAAGRLPSYKRNAVITFILFIIGGLILGPIVQKFAFGAYWTGWPFGEDLTDNKVLVSVLFWLAAILLNRKKERRWLVIVAALILFAIYMIPHSMNGSELNYNTGEVMTGTLLPFLFMSGGKLKQPANAGKS